MTLKTLDDDKGWQSPEAVALAPFVVLHLAENGSALYGPFSDDHEARVAARSRGLTDFIVLRLAGI